MTKEQRIEKANTIKAAVDATKPVTSWGMTAHVWVSDPLASDPRVRVYVNDRKRKAAAILTIDGAGEVLAQWQAGHSLTRNELRAALGVN